MRVLLQRVSSAEVKVGGETVGKIGRGVLLFLGVRTGDSEKEVDVLVDKILKARIFQDDNGKMNLDLNEVEGAVLVVSQFTLYAKLKKGNRPSFIEAASPDLAEHLYEYFCQIMKVKGKCKVETGKFGAMMEVNLINDGPVTLMYESE